MSTSDNQRSFAKNLASKFGIKEEAPALLPAIESAGPAIQENGLLADDEFEKLMKAPEPVQAPAPAKANAMTQEVDATDENGSFLSEVRNQLEQGASTLNAAIAGTPAYLYDLAGWPFRAAGLNVPTFEKSGIADEVNVAGVDINPMSRIQKEKRNWIEAAKVNAQRVKELNPDIEKGALVPLMQGDVQTGFRNLFSSVAQSAPASLAMMATGNMSALGSLTSGGAVFGSMNMNEEDQKNDYSKFSRDATLGVSAITGTLEMFWERQLGSGAAGKALTDIIRKQGKEQVQDNIKRSFRNEIAHMIEKNPVLAVFGEGYEEMGTQLSQNIVNKYSGKEPEIDVMDGVYEAGLQGIAMGGTHAAILGGAKKGFEILNPAMIENAPESTRSFLTNTSPNTVSAAQRAARRRNDYVMTGSFLNEGGELQDVEIVSKGENSYVAYDTNGEQIIVPVDDMLRVDQVSRKDYNTFANSIAKNQNKARELSQQITEAREERKITGMAQQLAEAALNENGKYVQVRLNEKPKDGEAEKEAPELGFVVGVKDEMVFVMNPATMQVKPYAQTDFYETTEIEATPEQFVKNIVDSYKMQRQMQTSVAPESAATKAIADKLEIGMTIIDPELNDNIEITDISRLNEGFVTVLRTTPEGEEVPSELPVDIALDLFGKNIAEKETKISEPVAPVPATQPVAAVTEKKKEEPAVVVTPNEAEQAAKPQIPVNKQGEVQYDQITEPDMYAEALRNEFADEAPVVLDELIAEQQEALKKAEQGKNAIERRRKIQAVNTELKKLEAVKVVLNPAQKVQQETTNQTIITDEQDLQKSGTEKQLQPQVQETEQQPAGETEQPAVGKEAEQDAGGVAPSVEAIREIKSENDFNTTIDYYKNNPAELTDEVANELYFADFRGNYDDGVSSYYKAGDNNTWVDDAGDTVEGSENMTIKDVVAEFYGITEPTKPTQNAQHNEPDSGAVPQSGGSPTTDTDTAQDTAETVTFEASDGNTYTGKVINTFPSGSKEIETEDGDRWRVEPEKIKTPAPINETSPNKPADVDKVGDKSVDRDQASTSENPNNSKQPWEMTREEFDTSDMYSEEVVGNFTEAQAQELNNDLSNPWIYTKYGGKPKRFKSHRKLIQQALSEGKPVPSEVLKDYPELQNESVGVSPAPIDAGLPEQPVKKLTNFNEASKFVDELIADFKGIVETKRTKTKTKDVEDGFIIQVKQTTDNQFKTGRVYSFGNAIYQDNANNQEDFYTPDARKNRSMADITQRDLILDFFRNFDPLSAVYQNKDVDIQKLKNLLTKYALDESDAVVKEIMDIARARIRNAENIQQKMREKAEPATPESLNERLFGESSKPTIREIADASDGRISIVSPASTPQAEKPKEYGADNKIVSKDRYEELKKRMKNKLNNLNVGFDPEILAIGTEMAAYHIEAGARTFNDFARNMVDELGAAIKPYLKSIYNGARDMPGMEELSNEMTSYDEVRKTNINEIQNQNQNEESGRSTETIESETEAIEREAENVRDAATAAAIDTKIDAALTDLNLRLNQLGYSTAGINHESPNIEVAKRIKKDVTKFSKELAKTLGWQHDTDRKGKPQIADANIAPVGGNATFILWSPDGNLGVYVSIPYEADWGSNGYENYRLQGWSKNEMVTILWRLTDRKNKYSGYSNRYAPKDVTIGQLSEMIKQAYESHTGQKTQPKAPITPESLNDKLFGELVKNLTGNKKDSNLANENSEGNETTNGTDGSGTLQRDETGLPETTENTGTDTGVQGNRNAESGIGDAINESPEETKRTEPNRDNGNRQQPAGAGGGIAGGNATGANREGNRTVTGQNSVKNQNNLVINTGDNIVPRGDTAKIRANLDAIKLAKKLNGQPANDSQKEILKRYTGWGGLSAVFKRDHKNYDDLKNILTTDEYESARESTTTSFYTPIDLISKVWDAVIKLGFKGGEILDPSAGIGHFYGVMPKSVKDVSNLKAVEVDNISGLILKSLYPDSKTFIDGFEDVQISNNSLDLVITNVPFGNFKLHDKKESDLSDNFNIHDYFIAKSIRKLKPGGLGVFITTTSTMDKSDALRRWIVNEGNSDVIDAFRLNTDTFKSNAGTEASSDIIIIRKRDNTGKSPYSKNILDISVARQAVYVAKEKAKYGWQADVDVEKTATMAYNKFFVENPDKMAGEMKFGFEGGNSIRPTEQRVAPVKSKNQDEMLDNFLKQLPELGVAEQANITNNVNENVEISESVKEGGLFIDNDVVYMLVNGEAFKPEWNQNKVKGYSKSQVVSDYIKVKEAANNLVISELQGDSEMTDLRKQLNDAYDTFVSRYGTFNNNTSISFLKDDVDFPSVSALENVEEKQDLLPGAKRSEMYDITKSDIFFKQVSGGKLQEKAESIDDAIRLSELKQGSLVIDYAAKLLNVKNEEFINAALSESKIFLNPVTGNYESKDKYLSGNIVEKLNRAKQDNENGKYDLNISALNKVLPRRVPLQLASLTLGSTWIPLDVYSKFFKENFDVDATITLSKSGSFLFDTSNRGNRTDQEKGIEGAYGSKLAMDAMNNKQTTITKREYDPYARKYKTVIDNVATMQAGMRQTEISDSFELWIKSQDAELSDRIENIYNDIMNAVVERKTDVSDIKTFPNATSTKIPRKHQKEGVIRALNGSVMLAHEVGTGKTITLITTAMEMRRLGLAKKPVIVVQRSTYKQFIKEIKSIYPGAKVLVPSSKDLTESKRKELFAKIAYNDWDIVVLYHSYLDSIPDDPTRVAAYIEEKIDEKFELLNEVRESGDPNTERIASQIKKEIEKLRSEQSDAIALSVSVKEAGNIKQIEKSKKSAETKAKKLLDRHTDDVFFFEQLGIDALLIDEAHAYKKLGFNTNLQSIKGIDTAASKRAQSLRLKTSYILDNNNGKNVVLATGTPISNTMAEMWTFLRYLLPKEEIQRLQIGNFDAFVNNFGEIEESAEFTTSGKFKTTKRFSKYVNIPELKAIWNQIAHTVLTEEIESLKAGIGTPLLKDGKPTDTFLPQTNVLKAVMRSIKANIEAFEKMSGKQKKENRHIPLVMFGLAKQAAIDVRLVNPDLNDDPGSKLNETVRITLKKIQETNDYNGTIAIFCDNFQSRDKRFNLFDEIKRKLVEHGIKAEQVAIINDYITDDKKERLFQKVNTGEVRVIIGTTEKLGVGVNIQERLSTLIHMDAPIRPSDYQQRNGRILRQGNLHLQMGKPVEVIRIGVEKTLDVTGYQRLKIKEAFIKQIMSSVINERSIEEYDVDNVDASNFSAMMANLSGSMYALALELEKTKLKKLENAKIFHSNTRENTIRRISENKASINYHNKNIEDSKKSLESIQKSFGKELASIEYKNEKYSNEDEYNMFAKILSKDIEAAKQKLRSDADKFNDEIILGITANGKPTIAKVILTKEINLENKSVKIFIRFKFPESFNVPTFANPDHFVSAVNDLITGASVTKSIRHSNERISELTEENNYLSTTINRPFDKQKQLDEATSKVKELQKLMEEELEKINTEEASENIEAVDIGDIEEDDFLDNTDIRMSLSPETPVSETGFYSTVENALNAIKQEKGTPEQMKAMLLKNGAKQAEMDWMGWDEQFGDSNKMVTKADIQQWIDQNKIEVKEVVKGVSNISNDMPKSEWTKELVVDDIPHSLRDGGEWVDEDGNLNFFDNTGESYIDAFVRSQSKYFNQDFIDELNRKFDTDTKFSQYQTPGGKNYKEFVLTMPGQIEPYHPDNIHFTEEGGGTAVAWVRANERTVNGEKVLFLEEIQSKRGQDGKKEGFGIKKKQKTTAQINLDNYTESLNEKYGNEWDSETITEEDYSELTRLNDLANESANFDMDKTTGVPDMPFKKTDQWVNLALRRMMRYAAENGFDRIAWTNGEQQADRYDLSKQVDKITYNKKPNNYEEGKIYVAVHSGNNTLIKGNMTPSEIENQIGKELAKKIIEGDDFGTIEVDGLKVGGEGMKAFYDSIIPNAAKGLGKPFGASVEPIEIEIPGEIDYANPVYNEPTKHQVQSIPVTQSMRESALKGLPLFLFAGEKGAASLDKAQEVTIRMDNLRVAREMEKAEKDAKTIRLATGWERGADGKWRYEVMDGEFIKSMNEISELPTKNGWFTEELPLTDFYQSDELYTAEPYLKDYKLIFYNYGSHGTLQAGAFTDTNKRVIAVGIRGTTIKSLPNGYGLRQRGSTKGTGQDGSASESEIRSSVTHEIQHVIQKNNGFTFGGNRDNLWNVAVSEKLKQHTAEENYSLSDAENDVILSLNAETKSNAKDLLYKNSAGEVEARNVQSRMNFTPEQRRETTIAETEDVSREDQIFLNQHGDVAMQSVGESRDKKNIIKTLQELEQRRADSASPKAMIVDSVDDLPDGLKSRLSINEDQKKRVKGLFYAGRAYYILDNIDTVEDAVEVWMHEQGIHYGITSLIPDFAQRKEFLEKVVDDIGLDEIKKVVPVDYINEFLKADASENAKMTLGDEYLAHLWQRRMRNKPLNAQQKNIIERFIQAVRDLISKVLNRDVIITEADVLRVAEAAIQQNFTNEKGKLGKDRAFTSKVLRHGIQRSTSHTTRKPYSELGTDDLLRKLFADEGSRESSKDIRGGIYNSPEYNLAKKVQSILEDRGINIGFSMSDSFGYSIYFTVYDNNSDNKKLKIRISDHSVSNYDRIFTEQHESSKSDPERIANDIELTMFPERYDKIQTGVRYFNKFDNTWINDKAKVENGKTWIESYNSQATESYLNSLNPDTHRIKSKTFLRESKSGNKVYDAVIETLINVGEVPQYKYVRKAMPERITVNGVERPTTNSNGKPIANTVEGVKAFYKWFGNSTSVDKKGRPQVFYHGSFNYGFDKFNESDNGIYFSSKESVAKGYAYKAGGAWLSKNDNPQAYAVYLKTENTATLDALGKKNNNIPVPGKEWKQVVFGKVPEGAVSVEDYAKEQLKNHDSVVVENVVDSMYQDDYTKSTVVVVKKADQIWIADTKKPDTIVVDGKIRPTTNSNGQQIHPTREGVEAFWRWFGESKVVDEQGRPLRLYHGSVGNAEQIKENSFRYNGFYTTAFTEYANMFAQSGSVIPVYANIKNPFIINMENNNFGVRGGFVIDDRLFQSYRELSKDDIQFLKDKGYDGIIVNVPANIPNKKWSVGDIYNGFEIVTFNPSQIKSATGNDGSFNPDNPDIRFSMAPAVNAKDPAKPTTNDLFKGINANSAIEFSTDSFFRWHVLNELVKQRDGVVPEFANVHLHATLQPGKNQAEIEKYEAEIWKPLEKVLVGIQKSTGITLDNLQRYMKAKHAPERNAKLRSENGDKDDSKVYAGSLDGVPLTDEYAKQIIVQYEDVIGADNVKSLWEAINKATRFSVDKYHDAGFIDNVTYKELTVEKAYRYYVPLRGWKGETMADIFDYQSADQHKGFQNPFIKAFGRESEADDPLPFIRSMAHTAIISGNKNVFRQKALNLAMLNKDLTDLFTYNTIYTHDTGRKDADDKPVYEDVVVLNGEVYLFEGYDKEGDIIKNTLIGTYADLVKEGTIKRSVDNSHYRKNTKHQAKQHEIPVYLAGKKYTVVMKSDPVLAQAIDGSHMWQVTTNNETLKSILDAPSMMTRTLSKMLTQYNPAFIPVNFIRDIGYATIAHGVKDQGDIALFYKNIGKARKAIHRHIQGKADPANNKDDAMFERFLLAGGRTGYAFIEDIDAHKKKLAKDMLRFMGRNSKWDKVTQSQMIQTSKATIEYLAMMSEDISRYSTFLVSKAKGRSDALAAADAKNVTVNFNRKGRIAPVLGMVYTFANAAIQGGANFIGLSIKHKKEMGGVAASMIAMSFLMAELMRYVWPDDDDDEKYDNINEFLRDNYMIIPNPAWIFGKGDDKYISIPLPHGFRFFWSLGAIASDVAHGQTDPTKATARIANNIINTFSPVTVNVGVVSEKGEINARPFVPSWYMPIYDIQKNEDFADRKVFKEMFTPALEQSTPEYQKGLKNTNKAFVEASRMLNKLGGGSDYFPADWQVDENGNYKKDNIRQLFNVNPAKLEHIVQGYTGGLGQFFNESFKTIVSAVEVAAQKPDAEINVNDVPVLKRLYRTNYKQNRMNDYYELKRQVGAVKTMLKTLPTDDDKALLLRMNPENNRKEAALKSIEKKMKYFADMMEAEAGNKANYDKLVKERDEMLDELFNELNKENN